MTDTETKLEFPINQELLKEATEAREEWAVIKDRLSKAEENKGKVSPVVFERVRKDYLARLKEAEGKLYKHKEAIDRELSMLRQTRKKISAQLADHQHKIEEIEFRNTLGEFSGKEYQAESKGEAERISKFETILNAVDSNIKRYETIFGTDEISTGEKSNIDDAGTSRVNIAAHIEEEGEEPDKNYFMGKAVSDDTNPEFEESATSKEPPGLTAKRAASLKRHPKVVIISGEATGTAFLLKGTSSIGRADSNTIPLKDAKISRQHAQIQQHGKEFVITDLNSSNGTYVNGQRIDEHVLSNGDEIQIGEFVLQFQS